MLLVAAAVLDRPDLVPRGDVRDHHGAAAGDGRSALVLVEHLADAVIVAFEDADRTLEGGAIQARDPEPIVEGGERYLAAVLEQVTLVLLDPELGTVQLEDRGAGLRERGVVDILRVAERATVPVAVLGLVEVERPRVSAISPVCRQSGHRSSGSRSTCLMSFIFTMCAASVVESPAPGAVSSGATNGRRRRARRGSFPCRPSPGAASVSYTHLTLPTIYSV